MPLFSFVLPINDNGMKAETPSFEAHQFVRVRRSDAVRRLIQRDKTPLAVLLMAAVVGTLAGLVGVAFEKSVNWVQNQRIGALVQVADHWYLVWPLAFILSGLLAMVGYFLVRRFAPEAGGSGIPEIEGRVAAGTLVARAAGKIHRWYGDAGRRDGAGARRADGAAWRQYRAHGGGCVSSAQPGSAAHAVGHRRGIRPLRGLQRAAGGHPFYHRRDAPAVPLQSDFD